VINQVVEATYENVARYTEPGLKFTEARDADQAIADDQQRPPFAYDLERLGNRAVMSSKLVRRTIPGYRLSHTTQSASPKTGPLQVSLRRLLASAGARGTEVDEVAADKGVVPDPGLVLRAVVEDHRAEGIPARFEAWPQFVLLGDENVPQQSAGDLAPAATLCGERKLPLSERHFPPKLLEV